MAILLDQTTKAEYNALSLASARASAVVSALTGTVVVEVYNGTDTLMASGTMAAPWATASGATITVGEVTGVGLLVATGGAPDANWYCQFRSGSRFVRGTFGVLGSGRDFVWSLASFQTGSRGTLGTVVMTAVGAAAGGPTLVTAPTVSAMTGTLSGVGGILIGTPAVWENELNYTLTGTVGVGDLVAPNQLYLGASASNTPDFYVGYQLTTQKIAASLNTPPYEGALSRILVTAYNSDTKVATTNWQSPEHTSPSVGTAWRLYKGFQVIRSWQWKRNNVAIPGAIDLVYTKVDADIGQQITFTETAGNVSESNDGSVKEIPAIPSTVSSAAITVTGSSIDTGVVTGQGDFSFIGWFKLDQFDGVALTTIDAAQSFSGTPSLLSGGINRRAVEITQPTLSTSPSNYAALPSATRRRPSGGAYAYPWEGLDTESDTGVQLGNGYLMSGICQIPGTSSMVMSFADLYSQQPRAIFATRDIDVTTSGSVKMFVPYDAAQPNSRWMSGTISSIPSANRVALGGDLLLSAAPLSIHSNLSQGPSAAVINSSTFTDRLARTHTGTSTDGSTNTIQLSVGANETNDYYVNCYLNAGSVKLARITAYVGFTRTATIETTGLPSGAGTAYKIIPGVLAKQLIGYRSDPSTGAVLDVFGTKDARSFAPVWDDIFGSILGAAIVRGTGSCLICATTMNGRIDYGIPKYGGLPSNSVGQVGNWKIYNPYNTTGPGDMLSGAYYVNNSSVRLWSYSVADMAAVVAGSANFYALTPRAVFNLALPTDSQHVKCIMFDNSTGRLYVVIDMNTDNVYGQPAAVVYQCNKWS